MDAAGGGAEGAGHNARVPQQEHWQAKEEMEIAAVKYPGCFRCCLMRMRPIIDY